MHVLLDAVVDGYGRQLTSDDLAIMACGYAVTAVRLVVLGPNWPPTRSSTRREHRSDVWRASSVDVSPRYSRRRCEVAVPDPGRRTRGPASPLPYRIIAGVVPVRAGWLVAQAKTQGTLTRAQPPDVLGSFLDVLEIRPQLDMIAVFAAVGVLDERRPGGRSCERAARALLGPTRRRTVATAPSRAALTDPRHRHAAEIDEQMQPYMQRLVHETHPELTFFQLNGERPTGHPASTAEGQDERRALLGDRIQGLEEFFGQPVTGATRTQVFNAAAALWTARRIFARAATRIPPEPEWDSRGLQMTMTY